METHRRDVLADAVVVDDWVRIVGVQVIHADVLIAWKSQIQKIQTQQAEAVIKSFLMQSKQTRMRNSSSLKALKAGRTVKTAVKFGSN